MAILTGVRWYVIMKNYSNFWKKKDKKRLFKIKASTITISIGFILTNLEFENFQIL